MPYATFKYRLYPSESREKNLWRVLTCARNLYNMALAERKYAWEVEKRRMDLSEMREFTKRYRKTFPYAQQMSAQTAKAVVEQLDLAFQAFFRRVKQGETPGYPRFKKATRFNSFLFHQYPNSVKVDGRRLKLFGVGRVRVRWHRPLEGKIKTVRILHKAGQWFAIFTCEVPPKVQLPSTGQSVGIDVGIAALLTTSTGEKVEHPKHYIQAQAKLRRLNRALERKKKGSKNRRKALRQVGRHHAHIANQRRDALHKLSTELIHRYDWIALEDLQIANMVRNKHLSKSILDAGWGTFKELLMHKAASAGRELVFVAAAYTSKTCSSCGAIFEDLDLSVRWVTCACGLSLDRDHNAAINILKKSGWDAPLSDNVEAVGSSVA